MYMHTAFAPAWRPRSVYMAGALTWALGPAGPPCEDCRVRPAEDTRTRAVGGETLGNTRHTREGVAKRTRDTDARYLGSWRWCLGFCCLGFQLRFHRHCINSLRLIGSAYRYARQAAAGEVGCGVSLVYCATSPSRFLQQYSQQQRRRPPAVLIAGHGVHRVYLGAAAKSTMRGGACHAPSRRCVVLRAPRLAFHRQ